MVFKTTKFPLGELLASSWYCTCWLTVITYWEMWWHRLIFNEMCFTSAYSQTLDTWVKLHESIREAIFDIFLTAKKFYVKTQTNNVSISLLVVSDFPTLSGAFRFMPIGSYWRFASFIRTAFKTQSFRKAHL